MLLPPPPPRRGRITVSHVAKCYIYIIFGIDSEYCHVVNRHVLGFETLEFEITLLAMSAVIKHIFMLQSYTS